MANAAGMRTSTALTLIANLAACGGSTAAQSPSADAGADAHASCTNDSDCATGGGNAACAYSTQAGRWQCVMIFGCAVAGAGTGG